MSRPSFREPLAAWALFLLAALVTTVTYARLDPDELYNVSGSGLAAGLGRALVYLDFPTSLAAIALVGVALERLGGRVARVAGLAAVALCSVTFVPGVVDQEDLDARAVNALPAVGVLLALALTVAAFRAGRLGEPVPRRRLDVARIVLAAIVVVVALPWIFAALGIYVGDVPGLGAVFLSDEPTPEPGHPALRAVHLGNHHGLDGALLALAALLLTRILSQLRPGPRRAALTVYLSLMFAYGLANLLNDAWDEQLVKRGWLDSRLPSMTVPGLTPAWGGIVLAAAALAAFLLYRLRLERPGDPPPARLPA